MSTLLRCAEERSTSFSRADEKSALFSQADDNLTCLSSTKHHRLFLRREMTVITYLNVVEVKFTFVSRPNRIWTESNSVEEKSISSNWVNEKSISRKEVLLNVQFRINAPTKDNVPMWGTVLKTLASMLANCTVEMSNAVL